MMEPIPIILSLSGTSTAGGLLELATKPFEPGAIVCVYLIAAQDEATDGAIVDLFVERSALQFGLETLTLTTHARKYDFYHPIRIPSDYGIRGKFSSAGNASLCKLWVYGFLEPAPEPPAPPAPPAGS